MTLHAPGEGERLVHFRDGGDIVIKAGVATGSSELAVGTQQVTVGAGIPMHRHFRMDEVFYVLEGSGAVVLDGERREFARESTIVVPKNAWHAFENPDEELLLLWMVSPAGLDGFFRDTCSPPGFWKRTGNSTAAWPDPAAWPFGSCRSAK